MPKKILHIILAIVFLPVCFVAIYTLYEEICSISVLSKSQLYFFYGCISYLVFHTIVFKPEKLYVFGHEMMHAIVAILSGGRVTSFNVSKSGGSVTTTKSNILISLAPYLFPFYTILVSIAYFILLHVKNAFLVSLFLNRPFLFVLGLTLTFHIVLTIDVLKIRQTDLLGAGYIFSIELIFFINILIIAFIFSILFKNIRFLSFLNNFILSTKQAYIDIFKQLFL